MGGGGGGGGGVGAVGGQNAKKLSSLGVAIVDGWTAHH